MGVKKEEGKRQAHDLIVKLTRMDVFAVFAMFAAFAVFAP